MTGTVSTAKFVSEVSSNHNQDFARCQHFIDVSANIGCDAVKFQLFKIDKLFSTEILRNSAQHRARSQWELPVKFIPDLVGYAHQRGIEFGCTPFYLDAVEILEQYADFIKISSYELLWDEMLINCAQTGKKLVLSTGMATIDEIDHAVDVIRQAGCQELTLLHCVSNYPVNIKQCNLAILRTLRERYKIKVGWSDHSVSPVVISRALNHWHASMIEFHLDIDGKGREFETGHCWLPEKIADVINLYWQGQEADGDGEKNQPLEIEKTERQWRADPDDGLRPRKIMRDTWHVD